MPYGSKEGCSCGCGRGTPPRPPTENGAYQKVREDVSQTSDAAPVRQREGMRREKNSFVLGRRCGHATADSPSLQARPELRLPQATPSRVRVRIMSVDESSSSLRRMLLRWMSTVL